MGTEHFNQPGNFSLLELYQERNIYYVSKKILHKYNGTVGDKKEKHIFSVSIYLEGIFYLK